MNTTKPLDNETYFFDPFLYWKTSRGEENLVQLFELGTSEVFKYRSGSGVYLSHYGQKCWKKSTNLSQKGNIFEHAMFWDTIYFSQMKPPHGPEQEHAYTYSFPGTILPFFNPTEYCIKLVLEKSYWKKLLVGFSDLFSRTFKLWQSKKHSIS